MSIILISQPTLNFLQTPDTKASLLCYSSLVMKTHLQLLKLIAYASPAFLFGSLHAQEKDPFIKKEGGGAALKKAMAVKLSDDELMLAMYNAEMAKRQPKQIHSTFEIFSLPANEAAELSRLKISGAEKYEKVIKMVKEKKANLELFSSINSRSGERACREATQAHTKKSRANANTKVNPLNNRDESKKGGLELDFEAIIGIPGPPTPLTPKGLAILKSDPIPAEKRNDPFGCVDNNANGLLEFQKAVFEGIRNKDLKSVTYIDMMLVQRFSELLTPLEMKARGFEAQDQVVSLSSIISRLTLADGEPEIAGTFTPGTFTPVSYIKEGDKDKKEVWLAFVTAAIQSVGK